MGIVRAAIRYVYASFYYVDVVSSEGVGGGHDKERCGILILACNFCFAPVLRKLLEPFL